MLIAILRHGILGGRPAEDLEINIDRELVDITRPMGHHDPNATWQFTDDEGYQHTWNDPQGYTMLSWILTDCTMNLGSQCDYLRYSAKDSYWGGEAIAATAHFDLEDEIPLTGTLGRFIYSGNVRIDGIMGTLRNRSKFSFVGLGPLTRQAVADTRRLSIA
jgi:hypothetical protein